MYDAYGNYDVNALVRPPGRRSTARLALRALQRADAEMKLEMASRENLEAAKAEGVEQLDDGEVSILQGEMQLHPELSPEEELKLLREGGENAGRWLRRRHRFVDPMYRRRRLKWLERLMRDLNSEKEKKYSGYYASHPDHMEHFPTNMGSVSVKWPSPFHAW